MRKVPKYILLMGMALGSMPVVAQSNIPQSSITIYGRIDLSYDNSTTDNPKSGSMHSAQIRDNASRWGIRGVEDLGGGLKVLFGYEFGSAADANEQMSNRNSYVGISGGFGAVAMGRLDSSNPTKSPIYSLVTQNVDFVIHDAGATAIGTKVLNARNRTSNSIGYISPKFKGLTFMARYYYNGNDLKDQSVDPKSQIESERDLKQMDLGLSYQNGAFALGVGYGQDSWSGGLPDNAFDKKAVITTSYDFGVVNTYALYGRDVYNGTAKTRDDVDYWLVGASVPVSANGKVTANYMQRDVQKDRDGVLKKFQIGYGYKLSKRTTLYVLHDREDPNSNESHDLTKIYSVGMQHNF